MDDQFIRRPYRIVAHGLSFYLTAEQLVGVIRDLEDGLPVKLTNGTVTMFLEPREDTTEIDFSDRAGFVDTSKATERPVWYPARSERPI